MNKKIIIIIILIVIVTVALQLLLQLRKKPEYQFKSTFQFDMPQSSEVTNYSFHKDGNECYYSMKFKISKDDLLYLTDGFHKFFGGTSHLSQSEIPNFSNVCAWWDLDVTSVLYAFETVKSGTDVKSKWIYAFISKADNSYYYVYVNV